LVWVSLCIMKKSILITGAETEDQCLALQKEVKSLGLEMEVFKLDITIESDRRKTEGHNLDVLINNAGIGESGSLAEIDMDLVRHNFEVNVFSAMELSQLAIKKMLAKKQGTVIFISSLGGRVTMPFLGPYSMTKFALSSGAEALRKEIHRVCRDVHVCLIEPGAYHTGFNQRNIAKKYVWMNSGSPFYSILDKLKAEEEWQFSLTETKTTGSIVKKIVKAAEAAKPKLRYSAPWWQAVGVQLLRMLGK
jgi:short-subunit dehydrogenase